MWFITHLPWLQIPEQFALPSLLVVWVVALAFAVGRAASATGRPLYVIGSLIGFISSVPSLPLIGTKTAELTNAADPATASVRPDAWMMALGFLALGAVLGLVAGVVRGMFAPAQVRQRDWLPHFVLVTIAAVAPLLFVGGLVTSTASGMAVPDWPNTFGSNMFLYPLGPRAAANVYLEHSHRLFGTLAGMCALVLMVGTLMSRRTSWEKALVVAIFALICVQGILGGSRVNLDSRWLAFVHGVLAQLIFGLLAALAMYMSGAYAHAHSMVSGANRRFRLFATGTLHLTILQLIFGAMYRHLRSPHPLYSHIGLSIVVVVFAAAAAFMAMKVAEDRATDTAKSLRWLGKVMLVVLFVQFMLGWAAFFFTGDGPAAATVWQALIRTSHQANGAIFLLLVSGTFVLARRLPKVAA